MNLKELIGENGDSARAALSLLEPPKTDEASQTSLITVDFQEVSRLMEQHDHVELLKGMVFIVCTIASIAAGGDYGACFNQWRKNADMFADSPEMLQTPANAYDFATTYMTLDLLDSTVENGGSFYLLLHQLSADINRSHSVIVGLVTMFHVLMGDNAGNRSARTIAYLHQTIDGSI